MIDVPTLFILGAGASKPYGYPTGIELRSEIIRNFSSEIEDLLTKSLLIHPQRVSHQRQAKEFLEHFSRSPVDSIDKYLALNPNFSYIGRIAITLCILKNEKTSKFLEDMDPPGSNEDWYRLIFNRMTTTLKLPEDFMKFRENKIAFITYNYDRSLEYFLYDSFYHTFWQSRNDSKFLMTECIPFPIIHVYGQVAELSPLSWPDESNYREDFNYLKEVEKLSEGVRVIGERSDNMKDKVKELIADYKRIFFLGFGYASDNLDTLDLPMAIDDDWDVYGTAKGMTEKEIGNVKSLFVRNFKNKMLAMVKPRIENKNSYELLREYL